MTFGHPCILSLSPGQGNLVISDLNAVYFAENWPKTFVPAMQEAVSISESQATKNIDSNTADNESEDESLDSASDSDDSSSRYGS